MVTRPLRGTTAVLAMGAIGALALSGCAKSASSGGSGSSSSSASTSSGSASSSSGSGSSSSAAGGGQQVASGGGGGGSCTYTKYGAPKLDLKTTTVGFSQSEATSNPFRATETSSVTGEAKRLGIKLIQRNANGNVQQQNTDIQNMIAQGAELLIVAPENSDGLAPAIAQAKSKHIPLLTIDRTVKGTACSDFLGFIGSNFLGQAKIAANDLGGAMGGKGSVAILQGTPGNNVSQARTDGFTTELKAKYPGMKVVASQTANFDQATGQKVTEQILQSNPNLKGLYAENDGMALGAIQAIKAAGKKPGTDIKIVSIDGIRQAVEDVRDGSVVSVIETNPRFGPLAFKTFTQFYGSGAPTNVIIKDHHFTSSNAKTALSNGDVY